jgi:hypothetical protein
MNGDAVATYLEAEVKCYHCGHISGVLRRAQGPAGAPTVFQSSDRGPVSIVKGLTDLRCARCQGSVYTDEFDIRYVYPKVDFLEEDEKPRRGRPPKRLVELRRVREAALKSA